MTRTTTTRRTVLKGIGAAITPTAVPTASSAQASEQWTLAKTPTGNTLHDVAYSKAGAYAVGGGGVIFELADGEWLQNSTPVGANLKAVAGGSVDLALGSGGTVLEK